MYKCDNCNYVSNRIFNFKKHKNRKNPCYQNEQNISLFEQNISLFEQNISLFEQNISSKNKEVTSHYMRHLRIFEYSALI